MPRRRVRQMERDSIIREARRGLTSTTVVGGGGGSVAALDDIGDVNAPAPSAGDLLEWDGAAWVPQTPSGSGVAALDDIGDVNAPAPADGDVLAWDATPGEWVPVTPAVGGGGSSSDHPIDTVPTVPHAHDDEFDGIALDAKWTKNPLVTANPITTTVNNGRLIIQPSNYALNARLYGIAQVLAGGITSFKITSKISSPLPGTDHYGGLIIGVSGGAGKGHVFGVGPNGANAYLANMAGTYNEDGTDWSGYDGYNNTANPTAFGPREVGWYRIRWDAPSSTIYFDYATEGDQWVNWTSRGGMSQPDRIGLGMYAQGNPSWTTGIKLNVRYFRLEANSTF